MNNFIKKKKKKTCFIMFPKKPFQMCQSDVNVSCIGFINPYLVLLELFLSYHPYPWNY